MPRLFPILESLAGQSQSDTRYRMIGRKDYKTFAGPDWPSYESILAGDFGPDATIQKEIKNFIQMMEENFQAQTAHGNTLAKNNQQRQKQIFFDKQYALGSCRAPWETMGINANGDVFICHSPSWIPLYVGNVLETTDIFTILNSDSARTIRQEILHGRYTFCNHHICSFFSRISVDQYQQSGPEITATLIKHDKRSTLDRLPKQLVLDFDYTCNLRCPSCRTDTINNNNHHVIRPINTAITDQIKKLIVDLVIDQPLQIRWAGGEPFISDVYIDLMQYITDSKNTMIRHVIQTNGSYLQKKSDLVMNLLPHTDCMRVSFDAATADTYHKVRVGGEWNQLLENVRWLRRQIDQHAPNCTLSADYVVQLDNYLEIPMFVDLCQKLGIKEINWQKMWNWGTWSQQEFDRKNIYNPTHVLYADLEKKFREINYSMSFV